MATDKPTDSIDTKRELRVFRLFSRFVIYGRFTRVLRRLQLEQAKVDDIDMSDRTVVSFVYGDEPMACQIHKDCPMRFHDEETRMKHYEDSEAAALPPKIVKAYQCLSCLRANKTVVFQTKKELIEHKTNPNAVCNEEDLTNVDVS